MKKVMLTIATVITSVMLMTTGGIITAGVAADEEPAEIPAVEEVQPEEITEEVEAAEEIEMVEAEPAEENKNNDECYKANATPEEIIKADTGLYVDKAKLVDSYGSWAFYEVFADGDIYAVTIKNNNVDVCAILN